MEASNIKIQADTLHLTHDVMYRYKLDRPEFGHNVAGHSWPSRNSVTRRLEHQRSKATVAVFVAQLPRFHVLFSCRPMPNTKTFIKMSIHHEVTPHTTHTTLEIYLQFMYAISALTLLLRSISWVDFKYGQFHKTITVNRKWPPKCSEFRGSTMPMGVDSSSACLAMLVIVKMKKFYSLNQT